MGWVRGWFANNQITKDLALLRSEQASEISWHFFASYETGIIGPSEHVLQRLEALREAGYPVNIFIHLPS